MATRILSLLIGVVGLGAILCSAYLYYSPPTEGPELVLEDPDQVFNDVVPGRVYEIEFRIHNRTGQTRRVLGGGDCPT